MAILIAQLEHKCNGIDDHLVHSSVAPLATCGAAIIAPEQSGKALEHQRQSSQKNHMNNCLVASALICGKRVVCGKAKVFQLCG